MIVGIGDFRGKSISDGPLRGEPGWTLANDVILRGITFYLYSKQVTVCAGWRQEPVQDIRSGEY
jgi:hypothetical protein